MAGQMNYMKYVSLCVLSFQTAAHVLVTRYSRSPSSEPYLASTVVTLVEAIKLIISILVLFSVEKGQLKIIFSTSLGNRFGYY